MYAYFKQLKLTSDQEVAIQKLTSFLNNDQKLFILKGYAGSGKTTLLKGLVEYLEDRNKSICLMAPTGRAAKVISEKTGFEASTIHKAIYSFSNMEEVKDVATEDSPAFIYSYKLNSNSEHHNSIIIVDEASMLADVYSQGEYFRFGSGYVLSDLIEYSRIQNLTSDSKIIFVGDPAQLPPVGMNFSPALDEKYLLEKYQLESEAASMKEVVRQNEKSGIASTAANIRKCLTSSCFNDFDFGNNQDDIKNIQYSDFIQQYKLTPGKKIIVTYKNSTAQQINEWIRTDKYGANLPPQPRDHVIIGKNNYQQGIMNGEFGLVLEAGQTTTSKDVFLKIKGGEGKYISLKFREIKLLIPDTNTSQRTVHALMLENFLYGNGQIDPDVQQALYVDFIQRHPTLKPNTEPFRDKLIHDPYFNAIRLKYGYAVTCHKAQGGEWNSVFTFWDKGVSSNFNFFESIQDKKGKDNAEFYRWAYTAITRASKKLYCINPPRFNSFSSMVFVDEKIQSSIQELTGDHSASSEVVIDNELRKYLSQFNLNIEDLSLQEHFLNLKLNLKELNIEISHWEKMNYEVRYTFKLGDETAGFKFWINGKNQFKDKFMQLPAATNSQKLYDRIAEFIPNQINYNFVNSDRFIDVKIDPLRHELKFDSILEEEKPFLAMLFNELQKVFVPKNIVVSKLEHLSYQERYTFVRDNEKLVLDFEYNGKGYFGRVVPLSNQSNCKYLLSEVKKGIIHFQDRARR